MINKIKRGDIVLADLNDGIGSEQQRVRPVLIIQNNRGNKHSPTTIIACLSSKIYTKAQIPTHYRLPDDIGLKYPSMVMCEQIRVIDKTRLLKKIAQLDKRHMHYVDKRIAISLNIDSNKPYVSTRITKR